MQYIRHTSQNTGKAKSDEARSPAKKRKSSNISWRYVFDRPVLLDKTHDKFPKTKSFLCHLSKRTMFFNSKLWITTENVIGMQFESIYYPYKIKVFKSNFDKLVIKKLKLRNSRYDLVKMIEQDSLFRNSDDLIIT